MCQFPCCRSIGKRFAEQCFSLVPPAGNLQCLCAAMWEVRGCLLRNQTEFLLNYSLECQRALAHTKVSTCTCSTVRWEETRRQCVPIPLPLFALVPSNYTSTIAEHRAQEASGAGLDDRILHICVNKWICDWSIELT